MRDRFESERRNANSRSLMAYCPCSFLKLSVACCSGKLDDRSRPFITRRAREPQKSRADSPFVNRGHDAADVMADELGERLVLHRQFGLRPHAVAELPLHHAEPRF